MSIESSSSTAMTNINLLTFPSFDVTEVTTLATRWKKYEKRFDILCNVLGVTKNKQKVSTILNYVGEGTFGIYKNILPASEYTYEQVINALDEHFEPKVNRSYETYLFQLMKQRTDETVQQYYVRLKEQSIKCNITDVDREIKQYLELNSTNNKFRRLSFRNPTKTFKSY